MEEELEEALAFIKGEEGEGEAGGLGRGKTPNRVDGDKDNGGKVFQGLDIPLGMGGEFRDGVGEEG